MTSSHCASVMSSIKSLAREAADAVHEDIDTSPALEDRRDHGAHVSATRHVRGERNGLPARFFDVLDDAPRALETAAHDCDGGALARERLRNGLGNATARTRDDRDRTVDSSRGNT